jgi:hypothetical protein
VPSPRLTDHEIAVLYWDATDPERKALWEGELRTRAQQEIMRQLPARTGICPGGLPCVMDEKGAYSSGALLHKGSYSMCEHKGEIQWDEPTPEVAAKLAILEALRTT